MRFRVAIFDFDGTLADSFPLLVKSYEVLALRYGLRTVSAAEIPSLRRLGAREGLRRVGLPIHKLPMASRDFVRFMRERRGDVRPFPEVPEMMSRLALAGVQMAVVSSNAKDNVEAVLGRDAMRHIRFGRYGMSIFGKRAHLRKLIKTSGFHARDAIYIGDQTSDIAAALAEGMGAGAVAWGWGDIAQLQAAGAQYLFFDVNDITNLLAPAVSSEGARCVT